MEPGVDPAPGLLFKQVLEILLNRYGRGNVEYRPVGGDVVIRIRDSDDTDVTSPYIFTDMQAKYLAVNPISDEDIRQSRFPPDWPTRT
jgi:hypothetical protein